MKPYDPRHHLMALIGVLGVAGLTAYMILSAKLGIQFAGSVGVFGAIAAAFVLRGPVGHAIARVLTGGPPGDETTGPMLAEMDELRGRVQELEERVDFSERLLSQHSQLPER